MRLRLFAVAAVVLAVAVKTPLFGAHAALVGLTAALTLAALLWRALPGGGRPALAGHAHGGDRSTIARHEAGHAVVAKALGGRVVSAEIGDNWGLVRPTGLDTPTKRVAFLAAGRYAAGTGRGCSGDDTAIRAELRGLSSNDRTRVRREGSALARKTVRAHASEVNRAAHRLNQHGRI